MAGAALPTRLDDTPALAAGLLAAAANVVMQLGHPGVGHGVVESTVESGQLFGHPIKRARTTLTYLAVATRGTEEDRRRYRAAVDRAHAHVRSGPDSPVAYDAFDPDLQLWVAACLYKGVEDNYEAFVGPLDAATAEALFAHAAPLGTTLQVPPERWPADRAAFGAYWQAGLARVDIDATVRAYLLDLLDLRFLPAPLARPLAPLHRFVTTGFLPPVFRRQLGLRWSPRQQRRFDRLTRAIGAVVRRVPRPLQELPVHLLLRDLRWRHRTGRALV